MAIPNPGILTVKERQNLESVEKHGIEIVYFKFNYVDKIKSIITFPVGTIVLPYTGIIVDEKFSGGTINYLNMGTERNNRAFGQGLLLSTGWMTVDYTTGYDIYKKLTRSTNFVISITGNPVIGSGWGLLHIININKVQHA